LWIAQRPSSVKNLCDLHEAMSVASFQERARSSRSGAVLLKYLLFHDTQYFFLL